MPRAKTKTTASAPKEKPTKKAKAKVSKTKKQKKALKKPGLKIKINKVLYDALVEAASRGKPVYFSEIAELLQINMSDEEQRKKMFEMIGNISLYEHQHGRPLLSAIVVRADKSPGYGFFVMARRLGLQKTNNQSFFYAEVKKVFDYWRNAKSEGKA